MSVQNEMRRVRLTNLEHKAKTLRIEIENLARIICYNMDCGLNHPEDLQVEIIDSQWDQLKERWAELAITLADIKKIEEELK